jgi:LuxR family maltose regulon positive regulatory protein
MTQAARPAADRASARRIIERPRLIKLLDETPARTILLIAPAGYGKTTLARQWAERQPGVHWYTARTGSSDVAQLAVDLAGALDAQPPKLKKYVSQLVRAQSSPTQRVSEIVEGFASAVGDATSDSLVIDDYHVISDGETAEWFVHELQLRLGFRLVVTSRVRPNWASARLEVYGETARFGPEQLALTNEEAEAVLGGASQAGGALIAQAQGWPAVVGLAAQTSRRPHSLDPDGSMLFRFFAEELFRATTKELQDQLITLALLPSLSRTLVNAAIGENSSEVLTRAVASGLATRGTDCPELHPLVREYLLSKLSERDDVRERVRAAFDTSLEEGHWDHALRLAERFEANDLLDHLIRASFRPLLDSGRLATLERIAELGRSARIGSTPMIRLIDAELAFRAGLFQPAVSIATSAATALGGSHPFASHAWWIAGMGAEMTFEDERAADFFEQAKATASNESDLRDALWGLVMAACQSERPEAADALQQIHLRRDKSSVDCVRAATARLNAWRLGLRDHPLEVERAFHELQFVDDPRIRTGFLNQYAYTSILWGRYDNAYATAQSFLNMADEFRLGWARPHAEWALAAASLGRRQFAAAEGWVRRVEQAADQLEYGQLVLNASCIRSRILLALHRPGDAQSALVVDDSLAANPAMRGEFMATRALVMAVLGELDVATQTASEARLLTKSAEAHAYAGCVEAICAVRQEGSDEEVVRCAEIAGKLEVWDAFIVAVRAWPPLLKRLAQLQAVRPFMVRALKHSSDYDLARWAGIDLGRRRIQGRAIAAISPREREVIELVQQGYTNAEIAGALFISKATVKVHIRHIFEKTGARSRTEAATRLMSDD